MNRKDLIFAVAAAALIFAVVPSTLRPSRVPSNFGDLFTYHYPMRHMAASALQSGRLPFWNAYIFSGLPLAANPQSALFYPPSALWAFLPLNLALSWDFFFHLFWAVLGVALLARRGGLSAASAWTLGLLYGLGPFLVYRVVEGIPTLLASLAWAPWCWLAWQSGRPGWLGAAWALQLLSGHPQFMVVNACGMALWSLFLPGTARRARALAGEGLWTCGLTAAPWLPTWEFVGRSVRRAWPREFSLGYSMEWSALRTWLRPGALGDPVSGTFAGPPSVFFETCAFYIGVLGLAAAAYGLRRSRRPWAAAGMIVAGVALALGSHNPLYDGPLGAVLSFLRTPSRWIMLSLWGSLLAAGCGLRRFQRGSTRAAAALFMLGVVVELLAWDRRFLGTQRAADFMSPSASLVQNIAESSSRLITDPELANPNKTMLYRARNANGYEAFYLDGYPQYASRSEGAAAADPSRTYLKTLGTPEMDRLAVLWRVTPAGKLESSRGALPLVYFLDGQGKPQRGRLALALDRPERLQARGAWPVGATALVVSQPWYPGWAAWLDGRPAALARWDGLLQSVRRPAAAADGAFFSLELSYAPTGWPLWAAVSLLAWAWWAAGLRPERA